MRLTNQLFKSRSSRLPQRVDKVPFQELLPLTLKNRVSGKGVRTSNVACLQEMAVLFSCLKTNDFDQALCSKEINGFQSCFSTYLKTSALKDEEEKKGRITPGEKKLTHLQLNQFIRKFPAIPPKVQK